MKRHDLSGKQFGQLIAITYERKASGRSAWLCKCACGKEKVIGTANLLRGESRSCGCMEFRFRKDNKTAYRHGLWNHPLSGTWRSMKQRCLNPKSRAYERYGGRGIEVCERWLSFENFVADNEHLVTPGTSLERKDNDGPYSPDNCRWATPREQSRNTSGNKHLTYLGRTQTLVEWAEEKDLPYHVLLERLYAGWSTERALTTPPKSRAILSESDVIEIRKARLIGATQKELASRFGVKPSTIKAVVLRRIWKHI